jgi:transcriptional regulator CtsR
MTDKTDMRGRKHVASFECITSAINDYKSHCNKQRGFIVEDEYKPAQSIKKLHRKFRKHNKSIATVISKVKPH